MFIQLLLAIDFFLLFFNFRFLYTKNIGLIRIDDAADSLSGIFGNLARMCQGN